MTFTALQLGSSEGVRMPVRYVRKAEKVTGVRSLAVFLDKTYRELAEMLARLVGHRYGNSALSTWAMAEKRKRMPRGWWKRYWMPVRVEQAFKFILREFVTWLTNGRYIARVSGTRRWRVKVVRV